MRKARPNILVILTDQQRKDSLGCYGNTVCRTPNLDRLARNGTRFERNYVANPICMPNRLSLFTGQHIHNHGLWTNGLLLEPRRTVADHLADAGYQTASFGKIHFTPFGGDAGNRESGELWARLDDSDDWCGPYWGFEHVELTIGHTKPIAHYGKWFRENGGTDEMLTRNKVSAHGDCVTRPMPPELHDSAFVGQRTAEFLASERDENRPFFVVASFPDPHHPFDPPEDVASRYPVSNVLPPVGGPEDLETRPPHYRQHLDGAWHRGGIGAAKHQGGIDESHRCERSALTSAMVELIDRNVGVILSALETNGLAENTIVVFTSDHGELLGDHGLWAKGPFFYEGLVNTPLIVAGAGLPCGVVSDALFSDVDLVPTLHELAGVDLPCGVDGTSQASVLRGDSGSVRDSCLIEYRTGYGRREDDAAVLVTAEEKYVRYASGEEELTHLAADPRERINAAASATADTARLRARLLDELLRGETAAPEQISHA
ncbi:MAG: sulfatase-like hydrolase/transferase [Chitinivibrionales bacterium]|nr:sulfatase-like hydrolase/transferase [Chitinivibrionales bacterium]